MRRLSLPQREIGPKVTAASSLLLFLDYDGTLTPIVRTPEQAKLSREARSLLQQLVKRRNVTVAVISGRRLQDVKHLVRVPGVIYAGNHGLEIEGSGYTRLDPKARKAKPLLKQLAQTLKQELSDIPRAWVENKVFTLSVHYRNVPKRQWNAVQAIVRRTVKKFPAGNDLRWTHGKCVVEIRPRTSWDKGACVRWLMGKMRSKLPIYIGDDTTDEAAFEAVNRANGISVLVSETARKTKARHRLRSAREVFQWLRQLCPVGAETQLGATTGPRR